MKISTQFIHPPSQKEKNRDKFLFQRITRRDIDNTHKVNGIS